MLTSTYYVLTMNKNTTEIISTMNNKTSSSFEVLTRTIHFKYKSYLLLLSL